VSPALCYSSQCYVHSLEHYQLPLPHLVPGLELEKTPLPSSSKLWLWFVALSCEPFSFLPEWGLGERTLGGRAHRLFLHLGTDLGDLYLGAKASTRDQVGSERVSVLGDLVHSRLPKVVEPTLYSSGSPGLGIFLPLVFASGGFFERCKARIFSQRIARAL